MQRDSPAGKGDRYRPVDRGRYGRRWERIFGRDCDLCGTRMLRRHCKLVCPRCPYVADCSDP